MQAQKPILTGYVGSKTARADAAAWATVIVGPKGSTTRMGLLQHRMTPNAAAAYSVLMLISQLNRPYEIEIRFASHYIHQVNRMLPYWRQEPNAWMKQNYDNRDILEPVPNADIWKQVMDCIEAGDHEVIWTYVHGYEDVEDVQINEDTYIQKNSSPVVKDKHDDLVQAAAAVTLRDYLGQGVMPGLDSQFTPEKSNPSKRQSKKTATNEPPPWLDFSPR